MYIYMCVCVCVCVTCLNSAAPAFGSPCGRGAIPPAPLITSSASSPASISDMTERRAVRASRTLASPAETS